MCLYLARPKTRESTRTTLQRSPNASARHQQTSAVEVARPNSETQFHQPESKEQTMTNTKELTPEEQRRHFQQEAHDPAADKVLVTRRNRPAALCTDPQCIAERGLWLRVEAGDRRHSELPAQPDWRLVAHRPAESVLRPPCPADSEGTRFGTRRASHSCGQRNLPSSIHRERRCRHRPGIELVIQWRRPTTRMPVW